MIGDLDAARLEAVLRSIGTHLDTGERDDTATGSVLPLRARWSLRRPLTAIAAAAAVLLVAVVVTALTPVGESVARWLGLGTLEVIVVLPADEEPAPASIFTDDVAPIDAATAWERARLDPATLDTSILGRPDQFGEPPEGGVVFGWSDSGSSLWVRGTFGDEWDVVKKTVAGDDRVEHVDVLGNDALFIDGAHVLETPARRVRADRVLWWIDDDVEYRLEATIDRQAMVEVAELVD